MELSIQPHLFEIFRNQSIIHCYSTRKGGFSKGYFNSLNLGLSTPDDKETVHKNRIKFFKYLDIEERQLAIPRQVHSANIEVVNQPGIYPDSDALITRNKDFILTIQTADCYPVFIYDPESGSCAIIHSGWRGTALNIAGQTIKRMENEFNADAQNMLIAVGAGIQQKNYQVDIKTAANFEMAFLKEDGDKHFKLDIQSKIIDQLLKAGAKKEKIEFDTRCTFENEELFYSFRRDGLNSGRMMGIIGLL